jgi:outer membrane protein assembly factor BamB
MEGVAKVRVATRDIVTAPASFVTKQGTFVALDAQGNAVGTSCPEGQAGNLIVLHVVDGSPPTLETAWCAENQGHGSPIVTTTDGTSEPIVWVTSDNSQRLHAFDGETGAPLFDGGDDSQQIVGTARFNTLIAVHNRLVVAADNHLYSFVR